jgi:hypothetical protein
MKTVKHKITITLGVEAEFEIRTKNWKNPIFAESAGLSGFGWKEHPIGIDGALSVTEIRTHPGKPWGVYTHTLQLKKKLEDMMKKKGYIITPFSLTWPTGLHIHFGAKPHVYTSQYDKWVELMMEVGKLHLSWNPMGRVNSSYGDIDDAREQPWGIEYRALPATLISERKHFYQTLKFAWLAAEAVVHDTPLVYPEWWEEYKEKAMQGPRIPKVYTEMIIKENQVSKLEIYDEWCPENRKVIKELFRKKFILKIFERIQKRSLRPITILLMGLRKERGIVYGAQFDIPGAGIPRCEFIPSRGTTLGVPWELRNNPEKKAELVQLVKAFMVALEDNLVWLFKK